MNSTWIVENWGVIATILWGLCELLNQIPKIKSNTVGELVVSGVINALKSQVVTPSTLPPAPQVSIANRVV